MKLLFICLSLAVVVLGSVAKGPQPVNLDAVRERAHDEIRTHLKEMYGEDNDEKDHCDDYPCCFLKNATDGCSIANMPASPSTLVFPGGKTRCIFSYSSDFAFQVWPGEKDKLLLYFQGGGACWDAGSTYSDLCTTSIAPQSTVGVFDRDNVDNKFSNYTIVHILYCSGDVHVGNVTRTYKDRHGGEIIQRGQANVVATYDWIVSQQNQGNLAQKFSDLVLMGQSAGSLGVQSWSGEFLRFFEYDKASVVPDSYIGVFPPGTEGPLIYDYGACGVGNVSGLNVPAQFVQACLDQEMSLQYAVDYWMQQYPNIDFGYLQSKGDKVQIAFYTALALSTGQDPILTQGEFYERANVIMEGYNKYPNFVTYLVDGSQHTFTPLPEYYTAGPKGPREGGDSSDMLDKWVPLNPLDPGQKISTVCDGKDEDKGEQITTGPKYCDEALVPKTYVQGNYN